MFNSRISSIVRKEFIQLFRDPRTLAIAVVIPIVELFLLGYAATSDVQNVPMAVLDQSKSPQSRELLDAFRAADYFTIDYFVNSAEEYQKLIESGKARVALVIPVDYDARLLEGNAKVLMILDGSDATIGATALSTARLVGQSFATKILGEQASLSGRAAPAAPVEVRTQVWYNPNLNSAFFMIPGVIGMILSFITTILTATAIVRERERGTIEQLIVTPIRSGELILGKLLPYIILAFVETFEIILIGRYWFGVPVRGTLGLIIFNVGTIPHVQPWDRFVCIHHCQHTTGSHADRDDVQPAEHFPLGFFLSNSSHAKGAAVGFLSDPASLLPCCHSFAPAKRRWLRSH